MGRIYQALQKSGGLRVLDRDSSSNGLRDMGRGLAEIPASPPRDVTQAVAVLLQNKLLTHRFGAQGEWEVRTTIVANRRAWRYRSRVFVHGKEVRKVFPPIDGDRTRQIRLAEVVSHDMLEAFAAEAVQAHFARCTSVAEHIRMVSIPSRPRRWQVWMRTLALILCGIAALATAYWLWQGAEPPSPEQPQANQPVHADQPEPVTPVPRLPGHWTW